MNQYLLIESGSITAFNNLLNEYIMEGWVISGDHRITSISEGIIYSILLFKIKK